MSRYQHIVIDGGEFRRFEQVRRNEITYRIRIAYKGNKSVTGLHDLIP